MQTGSWRVVLAVGTVCGFAWMARGEQAAPTPVGATLDMPVLSAYVWRGQVINDEAVVQPSLTVTKGGFSLNAWGNLNLTDAVTDDAMEFSEIDLTAAYSYKVGAVGLGAGYIEYLFPQQTLNAEAYPGTREVYASIGLPDLVVVPSLSVYYDFDEAQGVYAVASLGYTHACAERLSLALNTSIGFASEDYNAYYFGVDEAAFNDVNAGAALTWKVCDTLSITPAVQYTMLVDGDIRDAAGGLYKDKDQVVGSLRLSYTF